MAGTKKQPTTSEPAAEILGGHWDADAALVKSMDTLNKYISVMDEVDKQQIGQWIIAAPHREKLRNWHFYRCGVVSSPFAQESARRLRQIGWVDAPVGCFMRGAERDGEHGLNLCIPPEGHRRYKAAQAALESKRHRQLERSFGGGVEELAGQRGVSVDRATSTQKNMTAAEFARLG